MYDDIDDVWWHWWCMMTYHQISSYQHRNFINVRWQRPWGDCLVGLFWDCLVGLFWDCLVGLFWGIQVPLFPPTLHDIPQVSHVNRPLLPCQQAAFAIYIGLFWHSRIPQQPLVLHPLPRYLFCTHTHAHKHTRTHTHTHTHTSTHAPTHTRTHTFIKRKSEKKCGVQIQSWGCSRV